LLPRVTVTLGATVFVVKPPLVALSKSTRWKVPTASSQSARAAAELVRGPDGPAALSLPWKISSSA
jgi:hypothetical protein